MPAMVAAAGELRSGADSTAARSVGKRVNSANPTSPIHLFINIDHVATIRQARRGHSPDPVAAAVLCELAGADGITLHLREDRRHVNDDDLRRLLDITPLPVNLEMAATDEMVAIAIASKPERVTLVPERRLEVTTEGGLDAAGQFNALRRQCDRLAEAHIPVSLFIDATTEQIEAAAKLSVPFVELHTGPYAHAEDAKRQLEELDRLKNGAKNAKMLGLSVGAGHGLDRRNVVPIAAIPEISDLHIGHSVIAHAVFMGLEKAVRELASAIKKPIA
jgi:pyridoxine 5-phosphate synthase